MRRSKVVVLYTHPLFGKGIGQLLSADHDLDVTCLQADCDGAREQLERIRPAAIILEAAQDYQVLSTLQGLPPATVIRVSLDENVMDVYQRHQILMARPENLVDAIHTSVRHRHA